MIRRIPVATLVLMVAITLVGVPLHAAAPCGLEYGEAFDVLSKARLPQGVQQKMASKLDNAYRMAGATAPNARANALAQLDQALKLLSSQATKDVSTETRQKLRVAIDAYAGCLRSTPVTAPVNVTVRAFLPPAVVGGAPVPAGANVEIRVDGEVAGKTRPDSTVVIPVLAGEHVFDAVMSYDFGESLIVEVTAPKTIDLIMNAGRDFSIAGDLQVDELVDSVLQPGFGAFTARFVDMDGKTIKMRELRGVELRSAGGDVNQLTTSFSLRGTGELASTNVAALRQMLQDRYGPFELLVSAFDNDSHLYRNAIQFDLGRHRAGGSVASPAAVAVPLSGIPVRITNERSGFVFWATTGANGAVAFPALLPEGGYLIDCETVHAGFRYFCLGSFLLDADRNFSIRLFALAGPAAEPVSTSATTEAGQ